ncbi:MAG: F0F1 ATP synthase subunit B [Lachnospiraceae bacterium]|nr:F0F1 ATP synthase subunit B [Lachnospiraceae bacterium]
MDRLFGLDAQLLADSAITLIAVFVLYAALSYLLFNPVRDVLNKRKEKIASELKAAEDDKNAAADLKAEYTDKIKSVNKEAEEILSESRKKALKKETEILGEAKAEAGRIVDRANKEIDLEKSKVKDEVKQEMIAVATVMAGKMIATSIDEAQKEALIKETLEEMGDKTWQN